MSRAANSINARVRLTADNNPLKHETQLLREELRIKNVHLAKIDPRRRPYCAATERMAILEHKAARGWPLPQTARAALVSYDGRGRVLFPERRLTVWGNGWPPCTHLAPTDSPLADKAGEGTLRFWLET